MKSARSPARCRARSGIFGAMARGRTGVTTTPPAFHGQRSLPSCPSATARSGHRPSPPTGAVGFRRTTRWEPDPPGSRCVSTERQTQRQRLISHFAAARATTAAIPATGPEARTTGFTSTLKAIMRSGTSSLTGRPMISHQARSAPPAASSSGRNGRSGGIRTVPPKIGPATPTPFPGQRSRPPLHRATALFHRRA